MPHEAHKYVPIRSFALGLNTQDPPTSLGIGELQTAQNVIVADGLLQTSPGYRRVLKGAPNTNAYRLNGLTTHLRGSVRSTGSNIALQSTDWSLELFFRMDSLPLGFGRAALLYRGTGEDSSFGGSFTPGDTDYAITVGVDATSGQAFVSFYFSDGTNDDSFTNAQVIQTGVFYRVCVTCDTIATVPTFLSYVHEFGTSVPAAGAGGNLPATKQVRNSDSDLIVGAVLDEDVVDDDSIVHSVFRGVIQDVRFWDESRDGTEQDEYDDIVADETDSNLVAYYPLTGIGTNTYFLESLVGTGGDGSSESPILTIEPRSVTWRPDGHVLGDPFEGTSTIDLNGQTQGVDVPNAYLYRQQITDDDGGLPFLPQFMVSMKVKIRRLVDQMTLFHYVGSTDVDWATHTEDGVDAGGTGLPYVAHFTTVGDVDATGGQCLLEVRDIDGASDYRFRFIIYHVVSGVTEATAIISNATLTADTEYTVSAWINGAGTVFIRANSETTQSTTMTGVGLPPVVTDDNGQARKYRMTIGKSFKRTRQQIQDASSEATDVEYQYSRFFDGEIRQVIIADVASGNFTGLHAFNRDEELTRSNVKGLGLPIYSAWAFDDADGDTVEDYGLQQNPLTLRTDPGHVWGHSTLTTADKVPWRGLFDYRYRGTSGEVKKKIGIAAGSVYELDFSNRTATYITDGFRNDDSNRVSGIQHLDSLVLCAGGKGSGNYQFYKDQLYGLGIDPPTGVVPIGLEDQLNDDAVLRKGVYRWGLAFYSAHLDKWSPLGTNGTIEIKSERATIALGSSAEMNQTYARTPWSAEKEPFALNTTGAATRISSLRTWSWYGAQQDSSGDPDWYEDGSDEGPGGVTNPTKKKTIRFAKGEKANAFFTDSVADLSDSSSFPPQEVDGDELVNLADLVAPRIFIEKDQSGHIRINSIFAGENSFLTIDDDSAASAGPNIVSSSGRMDFSNGGAKTFPNDDATAGGADEDPFQGTGDASHGIALPTSGDSQVTHLGYFRSVAGGTDIRLVYLLPNGVKGFKDNVSDELNTGEVFDVSRGTAPPCRFVTDFENRAIYARDALNPHRVYFSEFGDPSNVPPQNFVDLLDGGTLPITGIGRTEGGVIATKDEALFVLSEPTNPLVPFDINIRSRDIGGTSPHGIVNVHENLFFPAEKGFYRFDLSYPEYLSERIEPTWRAVTSAKRRRIVGTHDRSRELILWAVPVDSTTLGGDTANDRIIAYNYTAPRDGRGRPGGWTQWTGVNASLFVRIEDSTGVQRIYFADDQGYVYRYGVDENYGVGTDIAATATVSAGTSTTVTVPQLNNANYPDGYRGLPITLVRVADNSRETRFVTNDTLATPSVLSINKAWTGANPVSPDRLFIGSREAVWKTGDMSPFGSHVNQIMDVLFIRQSAPTTASTYNVNIKGLGGVLSEDTTTLSAVSNAKVDRKIGLRPNVSGRRLTIEMTARGSNMPFKIRDMTMKIKPGNDGHFDTLS